jgi:2-succinyl-6-hydroxy-2,4-cyclohexadiene-1-carboxylate synthase
VTRVLALHGFTGSAATWEPLRARFEVVAPDLLGHGDAACPADPAEYAVEREVARVLAATPDGPIDVLGYSLGGRVALQLALMHPSRVDRLVLLSASPGIADPAERAARVAADERLATVLECDGIEAFVDRWERLPLWASQSAELRARLRVDRLRDPVGLANSLRGIGQGTAPPVLDRLRELAMPVTLIVGALDTRYVALAEQMAARIAGSRLVVVPGAGHALHLERPDDFIHALEDALAVRVA